MRARTEKIFVTTTFALCDNNGYTSTRIHNFFVCNGFPVATGADDADWIVISTCGFDQAREDEAKAVTSEYIRKFSATKRIIICGCLPKIHPELFCDANVTAIGPQELHQFDELFRPQVSIEDVAGGELNTRFISKDYGLLDCYYLQICQGCVNHCSYCAIKKAKGHVTSAPLERLVREVERAVQSGASRIMLLGDDCGSYGADLGIELSDLLRRISQCGVPICINYLHPAVFQRLYLRFGPGIFNGIEFLNIPVQATSPRILGLMNRHYDSAEVMRMVREVKAEHPETFFETHMIYGFPSETREEFQDTFSALDSFDSVIYFYYADRRNTPASRLQPKLTDSELVHRTNQILSHARFTVAWQGAMPPLLLLGYDLEGPEQIFQLLANNHLENRAVFEILRGAM